MPLKMSALYLARNGRLPNLKTPRTFNELVQARKLTDRNPMFPLLADKILVKDYVAERVGAEWLIPTLWYGKDLPEAPHWDPPYVLKSSHGSQQCLFIRSRDVNWARVRRTCERWLQSPYGRLLDEWLYAQIEPRLIVEPLVGDGVTLPFDYKFFVFGGRVQYVQVDTDREHAHKRVLFDRDWNRLPLRLNYPIDPRPIEPPRSLERMIEAAEVLGAGFDFVRVDLYEVDGRPLFGEMSFYPNSGLDRFHPARFDEEFGAHWLAAKRAMENVGG